MVWIVMEALKAVEAVFQRVVTSDPVPMIVQDYTIPHYLQMNNRQIPTALDNIPDIVLALNKIPDVNSNSTL
jgi:hypothetical protein